MIVFVCGCLWFNSIFVFSGGTCAPYLIHGDFISLLAMCSRHWQADYGRFEMYNRADFHKNK